MSLYFHRGRTVFQGRPPRLSHSPWALFLLLLCFFVFFTSSSSVLLYVHGDRTGFQGQGAQDGHLDFHTAPELRNDLKPLVTIIRFPGEPRRSLWTITPIHISQKQQQRVSVSFTVRVTCCLMRKSAGEKGKEGKWSRMNQKDRILGSRQKAKRARLYFNIL